jgi:2-polyprenyl-3-methyl-5-hydroxy-6-metoxy-1,4-benzoquinol methylase
MSIQDRDWYWEDYKKKETDYDGDFRTVHKINNLGRNVP